MKYLIPLLFLFGCTQYPPLERFEKTKQLPAVGDSAVATVGEPIYAYEVLSGYKRDSHPRVVYDGSAQRMSLSVASVSKNSLTLYYKEYAKRVTTVKSSIDGPWYLKQNFTRKYDFDISNGSFTFKKLKFEVVSVADGEITVRRIK